MRQKEYCIAYNSKSFFSIEEALDAIQKIAETNKALSMSDFKIGIIVGTPEIKIGLKKPKAKASAKKEVQENEDVPIIEQNLNKEPCTFCSKDAVYTLKDKENVTFVVCAEHYKDMENLL